MPAFNNGITLGTSTIVAGAVALPGVAGYTVLRYGVILAIIGGVVATVTQVAISFYRHRLTRR